MANGLFMAPFIDHLWPLQVLCEFTRSRLHPCTDGTAPLTGGHVYWPRDWWSLISSRASRAVCVRSAGGAAWKLKELYTLVCFGLVILSLLIVPLSHFISCWNIPACRTAAQMWAHTGRRACSRADRRGQMSPNRPLEIHYLGYTQDRIKRNTTPKVGFDQINEKNNWN